MIEESGGEGIVFLPLPYLHSGKTKSWIVILTDINL